MGYRLQPEAEADLDGIWLWVAEQSQSIETANRIIDALVGRCWMLGEHPQAGRRRDDDLRAGIRGFAAGQYVIYYRIDEPDIVVLHIVRGARDIEKILRP
ncbi:MAG: type II toxin-antitoxin system RelE/ParE family toxin [Acidobacteria bacterium]|nr:type II toxin-antitoxin system RelE/ParE family toxin [Acidobacteriota bacterium]